MIEKALKYIVGLKAPDIQEIDGQTYSDKPLHRINFNPMAEPINLNTLSSLVDYIKSGYDKYDNLKLFVHIVSPTEVKLYSALDYDRKREHLVNVTAQVPSFTFNEYVSHEVFCINLQAKFEDSIDRKILLKFAGTVEAGTVAQYGDDGVTQKATIKHGITDKQDALVPNPVNLTAYRTFIEVEQPETQYIFRMKQGSNSSVYCGLFEADGGAWKIEAKRAIREYLTEYLKDIPDLIILS